MAHDDGAHAFERLLERYRTGAISRRDFLRDAGIAAGVIAMAAQAGTALAQSTD
jgi:hypothetical protein